MWTTGWGTTPRLQRRGWLIVLVAAVAVALYAIAMGSVATRALDNIGANSREAIKASQEALYRDLGVPGSGSGAVTIDLGPAGATGGHRWSQIKDIRVAQSKFNEPSDSALGRGVQYVGTVFFTYQRREGVSPDGSLDRAQWQPWSEVVQLVYATKTNGQWTVKVNEPNQQFPGIGEQSR